jgi:hypothetical protein
MRTKRRSTGREASSTGCRVFAACDPDIEWGISDFDAGDTVVSVLSQRMRGRTSRIEQEWNAYAQNWTIKDGKIVGVEFFVDRARALQAAGLSEYRHCRFEADAAGCGSSHGSDRASRTPVRSRTPPGPSRRDGGYV